MDNVESANAAGDNYSVKEAQIADGAMTMLSALFGGVVPNTVWLGHPGLKKGNAGAGYSWISGVILGMAGIFGAYAFINSLMPPVIAAITFVWCSVTIIVQAFREARPLRHGAAVAVAFVPHMADYAFTEIQLTLYTQGVYEFTPEVTQALINEGVMWPGVPALKYGAIITAMIWATVTAFIIDKRLDQGGIRQPGGCRPGPGGIHPLTQPDLQLQSLFLGLSDHGGHLLLLQPVQKELHRA